MKTPHSFMFILHSINYKKKTTGTFILYSNHGESGADEKMLFEEVCIFYVQTTISSLLHSDGSDR